MMKKIIAILIALLTMVSTVSLASAEEWIPVTGTVYLPLKQDGAIVGSYYRLAKGGVTSEREFKLALGSALKGAQKPFVGVIYNQKAMAFDYETMEGLSPVQVNGRIRADYVLPEETPLEALQRHLAYTADVIKKNFKTTRVFKASVVKKSTLVFEGWLDMTESSLWELNPEEEGLTFKGAKVAPKKSSKPSSGSSTSTPAPSTPTPTPGTEETTEWTIGGETTTPTPTPTPSPIDWDIGGGAPSTEEDTGWTIGGTSSDSSSSSSSSSVSWDIGGNQSTTSSSEDTGWTIGGNSSDSSNSTPTTSVSWDIGGGNGSSSEDTGFTIGGGDSSNMEDTGFSI